MVRKKEVREYAVYWRDPDSRTMKKLPGASVLTIGGKPKTIQSQDGSKWFVLK